MQSMRGQCSQRTAGGWTKRAQNRWSSTRSTLWSLTFLLNDLGMDSVTKRAEMHICVLCAVDKEVPRTASSGTKGCF